MNIWLYWENKSNNSKPEYLNLCLKSILKHCTNHNVYLLNEKSIYDFIPNINKKIFKFPCIAHRADYIRAQLVFLHGGFWFDSDTILIKSIDDVINNLNNSSSDFIGCGRTNNRPSIGFFGGHPGSRLLSLWINDMDKLISESIDFKFKWTDLSYNILWKYSQTYKYYQYPFYVCMPYFSGWKEIFFTTDEEKKKYNRTKITDDTITIALYNSMFPQWFKSMKSEDILINNYYISDLFKEFT